MGNQFFQFAFGKAKSRAMNAELWLDASWYESCSDHTGYELGSLHPGERTLRESPRKYYKGLEKRRRRISALTGGVLGRRRKCVVERAPGYSEEVARSEADYYAGYWQSPRYFDAVAQEIRDDLSAFLRQKSSPEAGLLKALTQENAIAMHIRRGDFFSSESGRAFHGIDLNSYYRLAIDSISGGKASDFCLYIFSDDPNPLQYFPSLQEMNAIVCSSSLDDPYTDMLLMSRASNLIVANSSYSWWGGYLNQAGAVFAPSRWYVDRPVNAYDFFPVSWRIIEC